MYPLLLGIQGYYFLVTALWGLLDIDSFMAVTGPKTDIWLVKTVSVILVAIAVCLLIHKYTGGPSLAAMALGFASSLGLALVEFYYVYNRTLSIVYFYDGLIEVVFSILWVYLFFARNKLGKKAGEKHPGLA